MHAYSRVQYSTVQYSTVLCCAVLHCSRSNAQKPKSPSPSISTSYGPVLLDPHQHPTAVTLDSPQSPATLSLEAESQTNRQRHGGKPSTASVFACVDEHTHSCPKAAGSSVPTDDRQPPSRPRTPGKRKLRNPTLPIFPPNPGDCSVLTAPSSPPPVRPILRLSLS